MDVVTPDRLFTLTAFLAVLGLAWAAVWLRAKRTGTGPLPQASLLDVTGTRALGDGCRVILLKAAGQDVVIVTHRKAAPVVMQLQTTSTGQDLA